MMNFTSNLPEPILLSFKLNMPHFKANLVLRQVLLDRLTEGLLQEARLFLLSAPAGFGKTTLVCQWLNNRSFQHTWITLDENDNNPLRFLIHLLAAIQKIIPEAGRTIKSLFGLAQLPPVDVLITPLISDLKGLKERIVIVFDDYHQIRNRYIHEIIQFIIDHRPSLLHLVLITREEPPLALARMRTGGIILELKDNDLRFSEAESNAFMAGTMRLNLINEVITLLNLISEGWIAGLQLAALSIQRCPPEKIDDFVIDLCSGNHYIIDYLIFKVLDSLPNEIHNFLHQTAALDFLCAPLCNAVIGRNDSQRFLELLENNNMFLYSFDNQGQWYRYHHLFTDSILTELSREEQQSIHQKAACWYESNGYLEEAAAQALKASSYQEAEYLIRLSTPDVSNLSLEDGSRVAAIPLAKLDTPHFTDLPTPLSNRERELLKLVADGLSNEEIAQVLSISLSTTKSHIHNIFQKLGVNSRTKAILKAKKLNLV